MLIIITGLDGSGTSTIAKKLHEIDRNSILLKTPSDEFNNRDMIDENVREISQNAHYLYYLSSVVYISDYIKKCIDINTHNVYCVRYLIDTVVSHRVAGLNIDLDYSTYNILKPDLTIFVTLNEGIRQDRITNRGKSVLDKVLDNYEIRNKFLDEFGRFSNDFIEIDNGLPDVDLKIEKIYETYIKE